MCEYASKREHFAFRILYDREENSTDCSSLVVSCECEEKIGLFRKLSDFPPYACYYTACPG